MALGWKVPPLLSPVVACKRSISAFARRIKTSSSGSYSKGGKRKGMVVTAYGGFGQKAVIAHHLIAFDAITEFFYRSSGSRYPMED